MSMRVNRRVNVFSYTRVWYVSVRIRAARRAATNDTRIQVHCANIKNATPCCPLYTT